MRLQFHTTPVSLDGVTFSSRAETVKWHADIAGVAVAATVINHHSIGSDVSA